MLLAHAELVELVQAGVIDAPREQINGSSIDIRLGPMLQVEPLPRLQCPGCGSTEVRAEATGYEQEVVGYCPHCFSTGELALFAVPVDVQQRQLPHWVTRDCTAGYRLAPGEFVLAHSQEMFNLPNDISAEYKLKSSLARVGLEHLNAGFIDSGFHNANLTLEFKNMLRQHSLLLIAGMLCGQLLFFRHAPVADAYSYRQRGRYNGSRGAVASKGV